ncbi:MAG: gliding motility lipoprotein GldD [Bacteroidales bacterium]|nr:gliding motility lipoprotein GldD [Bacteroidales bacterium]
MRYFKLITILFLLIFSLSCRKDYTPRPRGYFRIDFPEKSYESFKSDCDFTFEIPEYGEIIESNVRNAEPCWYNLEFKQNGAKVYITYKPLNNNLPEHVEDVRKIVYKHIIKADDILETRISIPENKVYGIMYDIEGNAASSVNFYITDSISGFLSGSLYFDVQPNSDSLAPAIDFFREDIVHLINSFHWR